MVWRRIEAVITGRTRNAFGFRATRVRIPPSPYIERGSMDALHPYCLFLYTAKTSDSKAAFAASKDMPPAAYPFTSVSGDENPPQNVEFMRFVVGFLQDGFMI